MSKQSGRVKRKPHAKSSHITIRKAKSKTTPAADLHSRNDKLFNLNRKLHAKVDELGTRISGFKKLLTSSQLAEDKLRLMKEMLTDCKGALAAMDRDITHRNTNETRLRKQNQTLKNRVADGSELAEHQAGRIGELAAKLLLSEEKERRKLAADLHDNFSQILHVAKLKLSELRAEGDTRTRDRLFTEIEKLLALANRSARSLSYQLSPPVLYELGLIPALEWLGEEMGRVFRLEVAVSHSNHAVVLDEGTRVVLFRAARELLVNVSKHAGVGKAALRVCRKGNSVLVTVEDHGVGFDSSLSHDAKTSRGLGLFSIRERLSYLGGSMAVRSTAAKTIIDLVMPIAAIQ